MKEIVESRAIITETNNSVKILKGIIISCIITFLLLFIFALVLTYTNVGENTIKPVIIAITGVSILARKFYDNVFNKEKWNIKWRYNRSCLYITYLPCIKRNNWKFWSKYLFNYNDGARDCNWNNWWNSRGKFKVNAEHGLV